MKESSVLAPLLSKLREELPGSVVVKHRDHSMIGLPDASVTWHGRTIWVEGKLYSLPKRGDPGGEHWRKKAMEESPAQAKMIQSLWGTSAALYVIWIKKTCVYVCYPYGDVAKLKGTPDVVERFKILFSNWDASPLLYRPSLFTSI